VTVERTKRGHRGNDADDPHRTPTALGGNQADCGTGLPKPSLNWYPAGDLCLGDQ
jgi:hypothetical protein